MKLADAVRCEHARLAEIGDVGHGDRDLPGIARHPAGRRRALLGGVAIPLRPGGGFAVSKIEAAHHGTGLPTTVGWFGRPVEGIAVGPVDPPPDPVDRDSGGGQVAQENESFSSSATSLETSL